MKSRSMPFEDSRSVSEEQKQLRSRLTVRSIVLIIILATICSLVHIGSPAYGVGWIDHVDETAVPSKIAFAALVILTLLSVKGKRFARVLKLDFTPAEIATAYATAGFMFVIAGNWFIFIVIGIVVRLPWEYMRNPMSYEHLEYVSPLLYLKPTGELMDFYLGEAAVPWGAWVGPMFFWFLIYGATLFLVYAATCLLHHRWSDEERLTYPLVLPVVAVTETIKGSTSSSSYSFRNRFFLAGLAVPTFLWLLRILRMYLPWIPTIPLDLEISGYFSEGMRDLFGVWPGTWIRLWPYAVGVGFLMPTDLSFSIWFFFYIFQRLIVFGGLRSVGIAPHWFYTNAMFLGGCLSFLVFLVWQARHAIGTYCKAAFRKNQEDTHRMPMLPKLLLFGSLLSLAVLFGFGRTLLSISPLWMFFHLFLFLAMSLAWGRFRAEAGFPFAVGSPMSLDTAIAWFGTDHIPVGTRLGLRFISHWTINGFTSTSGSLTESFKLADWGNMERRSMLNAMFIAFASIFIIGTMLALKVFYTVGAGGRVAGDSVHGWPLAIFTPISVAPTDPWPRALWFVLFGAVVTVLFGAMRARYVWWPFHPIGFLFSQQLDTYFRFPGPFFIAWLVKVLGNRYGGGSFIERVRPFFVGLIVADVGMEVINAIVRTLGVVFF